jgi:hypothetical protein
MRVREIRNKGGGDRFKVREVFLVRFGIGHFQLASI